MITLRPHHGLCIQFFIGKGYTEQFVESMQQVVDRLNQNEDAEVLLCLHTDVICLNCPHNQKGQCQSGQKVLAYDSKCLELCNLKEGESLLWSEYRQKIEQNIIAKKLLKQVCEDCKWFAICDKLQKAGIFDERSNS